MKILFEIFDIEPILTLEIQGIFFDIILILFMSEAF